MRRLVSLGLPLLAALFVTTSAAEARPGSWCEQTATNGTVQDWTCQWGPVDVRGYEVRQDASFNIPKPPVSGSVTAMDVDVTDADGTPISIKRLMLHHIVFLNLGETIGEKKDATCGQFTMWDERTTLPGIGERFYAAGEERARFEVPKGYGYKTAEKEQWGITWMVMNHRKQADRAFIRYHVSVDTATDLTPVTPYWLDVENCRADPVYDVPGGGKKGSTHDKTSTFRMPRGGRLVASSGHVHGGAKELAVTQPGCGNRTLFTSKPAWGLADDDFYTVKPVLHEPGPRSMSAFLSQKGQPIAAGEDLVLHSRYDNQLPHTRVMGISVMLVAHDDTVTEPCGAVPDDVQDVRTSLPHRRQAPVFTVPLVGLDGRGVAREIERPAGRTTRGGGTITVGDNFFSRPNVEITAGTTLNYKFPSKLQLHNVTLASGPRGFASKNLDRGRTYKVKLTTPGTYRIFCALHPVAMTERVVVRRKRG